jgi:hypothetical protein
LHLELGQRRSTCGKAGVCWKMIGLIVGTKVRGYACCDQGRHENLIYRLDIENLGSEEEASYNQSQLLSIKIED